MRAFNPLSLLLPLIFITIFIITALQFAFVTPIFEAPDESGHYSMVSWLADGHGLPNQYSDDAHATGAHQEGSQPPLFYAIASVVARLFDRSELPALRQTNPNAALGFPHALINKNAVMQHEPYPPDLSGSRIGVYAVRLLNVFFGALTVYAVWQTARSLVPENPRIILLATGLAAFNPQFAFISGAVNNDILIAALGSLTLWQATVMLQEGFKPKRSLLLGILVALAALTKLSGLSMGVIVALAAIIRMRRQPNWRGFFTLAATGVGLWALIAGWWYLRNLQLYHDFTGASSMLQWVGYRGHIPFEQFIVELSSLSISYWGLFGWFNVLAPQWFYFFVDLSLILAGIGIPVGLVLRVRAGQPVDKWLWLISTLLLSLAALTVWTLTTHGTQGRLIFPYIAAISLLLAFGLRSLAIPPAIILIPLALFSLASPAIISIPAYSVAAPISALPESAVPLRVAWGGEIMLIGYEPIRGSYHQGDLVPVTLYWQPVKTSNEDYSIFIHLVGPARTILGQVDTYPAGGLRRTTQWQPDMIYPDHYQVRLSEAPAAGSALQLIIGWYNNYNGVRRVIDNLAVEETEKPLYTMTIPAGSSAP